jgi:hypothetical protein
MVTSDTDRAELIARRESLKARIEQDRRLKLVQPIIDFLNERGVAYSIETDSPNGYLGAWPVVGSQIDWASIPGARWIGADTDTERDLAVRYLLTQLSSPEDRVNIIATNGDVPVVRVRSIDLETAGGAILGREPSLYMATSEEDWLIEHIKGRGLWGGLTPNGPSEALGPESAFPP